MKKLTALLCMIAGLNLAACSSPPAESDMSETVADIESSGAVRSADTTADTDPLSYPQTGQEAIKTQYADVVPTVYMVNDITSEALCSLYQSLGREVKGEHIAVGISTGGASISNGQDPELGLVLDLAEYVNGAIVECKTECRGSDPGTEMYDRMAADGSLFGSADVVVLDEGGSAVIPVEEGVHLTENYVGAHFLDYDGFLMVAHFKGHAMAGFSGAIGNISIGIASEEGKCLIYSAGGSRTDPESGSQDAFLESMAEAGKSVVDELDRNIIYINIINHLSIGCDCNGNAAEPDIHDIGILACADPVALDQACVDLIYMADGNEVLVGQMEERNAEYVLEYAEEIGLGNSAYTLVSVD